MNKKNNKVNEETLIDLVDDGIQTMKKSERTRLNILVSAAKVFSEKGYHNTSIQDIANDAGIAKGTVYYYIETKEDLISAILNYSKERLFSKIERSMDKTDSAAKKLEIIVKTHMSVMKSALPVLPLLVQNILSEDSQLHADITGFRKRYIEILEEIIDEGIKSGEFREVSPKQASVAILGMLIGQILQSKLIEGTVDTKQITDITIDIAKNGLVKNFGV